MIIVPQTRTGEVIPETPMGPLTLLFSSTGLTQIKFGEISNLEPAGAPFEIAARELDAYFSGERIHFSVTLDPQGTTFQKRVWALLKTIPYGETRSYGQIARLLGDVGLARAVGRANGSNPIPIICPCHRVIGANGQLTGYRGGIHRKEFLLRLEDRSLRPDLFSHFEDTQSSS